MAQRKAPQFDDRVSTFMEGDDLRIQIYPDPPNLEDDGDLYEVHVKIENIKAAVGPHEKSVQLRWTASRVTRERREIVFQSVVSQASKAGDNKDADADTVTDPKPK
jgi:hypothetical protein